MNSLCRHTYQKSRFQVRQDSRPSFVAMTVMLRGILLCFALSKSLAHNCVSHIHNHIGFYFYATVTTASVFSAKLSPKSCRNARQKKEARQKIDSCLKPTRVSTISHQFNFWWHVPTQLSGNKSAWLQHITSQLDYLAETIHYIRGTKSPNPRAVNKCLHDTPYKTLCIYLWLM